MWNPTLKISFLNYWQINNLQQIQNSVRTRVYFVAAFTAANREQFITFYQKVLIHKKEVDLPPAHSFIITHSSSLTTNDVW